MKYFLVYERRNVMPLIFFSTAPPYPCVRPDLLQCLTCYNQPTDEDCNINGFYEFCDGVEEVYISLYLSLIEY